MLIEYKFATNPTLPAVTAPLKEYWVGTNGAFVRAERPGLCACIPIARFTLPGLSAIAPTLKLNYPRVPVNLVAAMLRTAQQVGNTEVLFYLTFAAGSWQLDLPAQLATASRVTPLSAGIGSTYETALIEVHSHCSGTAHFSATDDREERGKFRLFAVFGQIFTQPTLNLRVGVYDDFWSLPADWIFELPAGVKTFS